MTKYYIRADFKEPLPLNEIEVRCTKYVRNVMLGIGTQVTLDSLKKWLELDMGLVEFPDDEILNEWLQRWTPEYLAEWSFNNDFIRTVKDN